MGSSLLGLDSWEADAHIGELSSLRAAHIFFFNNACFDDLDGLERGFVLSAHLHVYISYSLKKSYAIER